MPDTGFLYSNAQSSVNTGTSTWLNTSNIGQLSGESSSSFSAKSIGDTLRANDYGTPIGSAAVIVGIEVEVTRRSLENIYDEIVQLRVGGDISMNLAKVLAWEDSSEIVLYGGPLDTWGLTGLTADSLAELNVELSVENTTKLGIQGFAYVSSIRAKFYYQPPSAIGFSRRRRQLQSGGLL